MRGVFLRKLRKKLVDFASLFWQGDFFFLPGYFPADFDLIKICRCQAAVGGAFDICFTGKGDAAGAGAVRLFFGFEQGLQNSLANPGFVFDGCFGAGVLYAGIFLPKTPLGFVSA